MNVNTDIYAYISIGLGGLCLTPQIISGYRTRSLKDVSSMSLIYIFISSGMFSYKLYINKEKLYSYISGFITLNSIILLWMQFMLYYRRFKEHVKTFESKPPTPTPPQIQVPLQAQAQLQVQTPLSTNVVQLEVMKNDDNISTEKNL